jgi:ribonucleotide reductase alpha subunit
MRTMRTIVLAVAFLTPVAAGHADERTEKQKKGALKEQQDPAKDAKLQKENVAKLRENAATDRKAGNRVAAWAAESDAKHAEKLIKKDDKLLQEGKAKPPTKETKAK